MKRLSQNYSWSLRLTGYGSFLLVGIIVLPCLPIVIWALCQTEINRHKTKYMMKLNDWAVYNPDKARSMNIEPNYTAAFNVGGLAGIYLNITSSNAEPLLEEYCRKGNKITRCEIPNLTDAEIEFLMGKLRKFNSWDTIGCLIPIALIILAMLIAIFIFDVPLFTKPLNN
ncbi:hypothetical protein [Clostridium sp.]|uniref:hypothetical protein n=1 Tax=Clostridium sp. TaxID=1506 RepID=UPI002841C707|nr:hypothetical protein [Clostridium sp.]MDR3598780.1 hypothetical protein [Clostridium sp.]